MDPFPPPAGGSSPPPVEPPPPVGPEQPVSGKPIPSMPAPPEPKKSSRKLLLIGIAVLLVVAIVAAIAANSGGKKAAAAASTSTSPSPTVAPRPPAPTSLQAKASAFKVVLTWSVSTGDFVGYRILRDGAAIDVVSAGESTYTDQHALPTSTYMYGVETYTLGGSNSDPTELQVKTPKGTLSAARLTGVYNVHLKATSQFGFQSTVSGGTLGWRFKPACADGACDAGWTQLGTKDRTATLKRSGPSYRGVDPSAYTASCNGIHVNGTVTVTVKVLKAAVVAGMWVATQIAGTYVESAPSELGCVSSGVTYSFTAKLVA